MTATYWEIGRRIVEFEQRGAERAQYGKGLLKRLSGELVARFGRGFSQDNLERFRLFYLRFPLDLISETASRKSSDDLLQATTAEKSATVLRISGDRGAAIDVARMIEAFPLPWSHYVLLIRLRSDEAVRFYHAEALRGGWSVRQLKRQIDSQFYERTALSKNKAAMLQAGQETTPDDIVSAEEEIKDPLVLEFLGLRDEYSESDLEEALIRHLETFLLELGGDFAFVARQRRLRIDDEWYRVDLVFFHRCLKCLVLIDLKLGKFSHADAGQMNMYLNYAREHWTHDDENPPVGIILCAAKGQSLARYATAGLENKMLVSKYLTALPDEKLLAEEIDRTRRELEKKGMV
jgi:predicted nuclease of restriction endonuclease-like (RecB) superfamily